MDHHVVVHRDLKKFTAPGDIMPPQQALGQQQPQALGQQQQQPQAPQQPNDDQEGPACYQPEEE